MISNLTGEMGDGEHSVFWHCRDDNGNIVPSGVYYYRVSIDSSVFSGRMVNLK